MDRGSASDSLERSVDSHSTYFSTAPTILRQTEIRYLATIVMEGKKDGADETQVQAMRNAAQKIAEGNLPLVIYIAKRYGNSGVDLRQLVSAGNLGLMRAAYEYDVSRINPDTNEPYRFSTYAGRCIKQHIQNEIVCELTERLRDHEDPRRRGLLVSMEVALEGGIESVARDRRKASAGFELPYEVEEALRSLNEEEITLIKDHYGLGCIPKDLNQIGTSFGLTRSAMSLRHTKILGKMKRALLSERRLKQHERRQDSINV